MSEAMKILVVDDEQDVELLFRQRFRREIRSGLLQLSFALSGKEALSYLENGGSSDLMVLLSDINMPGMSGIELLRKAKEAYPDLPVYMITAYGDETNQLNAIRYGCDGYMTKPLDFKRLKTEVLAI
jgi:CheY-like chemotaxis protein